MEEWKTGNRNVSFLVAIEVERFVERCSSSTGTKWLWLVGYESEKDICVGQKCR